MWWWCIAGCNRREVDRTGLEQRCGCIAGCNRSEVDRTRLEQRCGGGALQGAIGGKWIGRDWHRDVVVVHCRVQ